MTTGDTPWMVRLSMVVRSPREDFNESFVGSQVALENHSPDTTVSDHYYRKALTTEVTVRNLRIQSVM